MKNRFLVFLRQINNIISGPLRCGLIQEDIEDIGLA